MRRGCSRSKTGLLACRPDNALNLTKVQKVVIVHHADLMMEAVEDTALKRLVPQETPGLSSVVDLAVGLHHNRMFLMIHIDYEIRIV